SVNCYKRSLPDCVCQVGHYRFSAVTRFGQGHAMLGEHIRAVFFDAVGTLIVPDPPVAEAYIAAGRRYDVDVTPEEFARRFARALQREEEAFARGNWATGERAEAARWWAIVQSVFQQSGPTARAIFQELYAHFAKPSSWRDRPEAAEVLKSLSDRG